MSQHLPPPRDDAYARALAFWYGRINYEQRPARPRDLGLETMRALLSLVGEPHRALRVVHVAGSKGKGSTAALLDAVLRQAGYRTGLFTSPHLSRVEERFLVDGKPIRPAELTRLLDDLHAALDRSPGLQPTFFEIATAAGFLHFQRRRVDVAILEVGLGGRLDSTNVCQPELALITSISYDHTQQLGNTLSAIAREKAGIVKRGVPTLSGATAPAARAILESTCRHHHAPLWQLGTEIRYDYRPGRVTDDETRPGRVAVTTPAQHWPEMALGLMGDHQAANAALAAAAVDQLRRRGLTLPDAAVAAGLAGVVWPGRLEVLRRRPLVVLDCAHNVASAEALTEALLTSFPPVRRWLVFGGSADKDLGGMLGVLAPLFHHVFLTRSLDSTRAVPPGDLPGLLPAAATPGHTVCPTPNDALRQVLAMAAPEDLVCVTGSVFLVGEVRERLAAPAAQPAHPARPA